MVAYYCDLGGTYSDVTGLVGAKQGGPGGFQAIIRGTGACTPLAAGDTCYLKGTAKTARLVQFTVTVNAPNWVIGDAVRNDTGDGDHWTGIICQVITASTVFLVELASGKQLSDAYNNWVDDIENTTRAETRVMATASSVTEYYLRLDNGQSGDLVSGYIDIIGTNSSYATGYGSDYLAILDCDDTAGTNISRAFSCTNGEDYIKLTNIWCKNSSAVGFGFGFGSSTETGWIFDHCKSTNNVTPGINATGLHEPRFIQCVITNNAGNGVTAGFGGLFFDCRICNNGGYGISAAANNAVIIGCMITGNTNSNILCLGSIALAAIHCVLDDSGAAGINIDTASTQTTILFCRATNNTTYGISMAQAVDDSNVEDYNIFYGNGTAARLNIVAGANSDDDPVNDGYMSATNFNIKRGAEISNTMIDLYWDGETGDAEYYGTAGLINSRRTATSGQESLAGSPITGAF